MISSYAEYWDIVKRMTRINHAEQTLVYEIYKGDERREAALDRIAAVQDRLTKEFMVLFLGVFPSGKSSMINALLGYELLPCGLLPKTAVITELHFGEKRRITVYPKEGVEKGVNQPFDLENPSVDELEKYLSLIGDDGESLSGDYEESWKRRETYERIVIYWPLDVLKDGMVFVDTPGATGMDILNNEYFYYLRDNYFPKADAIVYVMDSCHAYQRGDKEALDIINGMWRRDIIIGYTFYDALVKLCREERLEQTCNILIRHMAKHSDLGSDAVHFLDSKEGLRARMEGDEEALRCSGYERFENYLEKYLLQAVGMKRITGCIANVLSVAAHAMEKCMELEAQEGYRRMRQMTDIQNSVLDILKETV